MEKYIEYCVKEVDGNEFTVEATVFNDPDNWSDPGDIYLIYLEYDPGDQGEPEQWGEDGRVSWGSPAYPPSWDWLGVTDKEGKKVPKEDWDMFLAQSVEYVCDEWVQENMGDGVMFLDDLFD